MAFTFFFRDRHTLELIVKHSLPVFQGCQKIRIWDAGSAMGPEPYSLAIIFSETMGHFAFKNLRISATDIDESGHFGEIISDGIYPEEQLKRIPGNILGKYFERIKGNGHYKITSYIKDKLEFERHDLLTFKSIGKSFHLILCKNVLLHFKQEQRIQVIKMFYNSLEKGGIFATEQTQKLPDEVSHMFERITTDAQIFRKVEV